MSNLTRHVENNTIEKENTPTLFHTEFQTLSFYSDASVLECNSCLLQVWFKNGWTGTRAEL